MFNNTYDESYTQIADYVTSEQDKFYRIAFTYVRNEQLALDIVQDSIYKALTKHKSLKNPDFLKTWFYRILVNESLSALRKQKPLVPLSNIMNLKSYTDQHNLDESNLFEKLNDLPSKIKTVIILHYFEQLTLQEIAEISNTNLSTVKSRLYKGLKLLKVQYKEEQFYE